MKALLIVTFSIYNVILFGQDFEKSKQFVINDFEAKLSDEYYATPDSLKEPILIEVKNSKTNELKYQDTLYPYDVYGFGGFILEESEIDGYKNVKSIVKISYDYSGCCSNVFVLYYLVKNNGDWVSLPVIDYVICDWPANIPDYTFELNQNPIIQTVTLYNEHYNEQGDLYKKEQLNSFDWNGKFLVKKEE